MMKEPLSSIISNSKSYKSLRDEIDVANFLSQRNWGTTVGPIYKDVLSGKLREIDVRARRAWWVEGKHSCVNVVIFCESKCIDGSHIIFSESPSTPSDMLTSGCHTVWEGHQDRERELRFLNMLERLGIEEMQSQSYLDEMESVAYPNQVALVDKLMVPPLHSDVIATTYKETTINNEKSTSNSVLWRACQGVKSVMDSTRHEIYEATDDDLEYAIRKSHHRKGNKSFLSTFKRLISFVTIFHPLVVVDAKLWNIEDNGAPREINSCRYVQRFASKEQATWYDIVSREYAETYIDNLTSHYNAEFEKAGCLSGKDPDAVLHNMLFTPES